MNATAKLKTPFNALAESVVDPYAINFWIQKLNPLWSVNQPLGKIVHKEIVAESTVSLKIQVNRLFKFGEAGQHHPVYVVVNGIRYERSYSLTKLDTQHVLLTVKKVSDGKISNWFANTAKVGDILEFGQPFGDMTLPAAKSPILLLAAGSGITPMLSLLTELSQQTSLKQPVQLWYWVKKDQDAAFVARFQKIADKFPEFSFKVFVTQAEQAAPRLNADYLDQLINIEQTTVYACGPSGFATTVEQLFTAAKTVKTEAFSMSMLEQSETGFVNITLTQSNKTVTIPKGQSILTSLEQHNIRPNHGCRMGICNKCACNKVEGSTKNLVNGAQNSEPGNLLKICVNSAKTDLVIDL